MDMDMDIMEIIDMMEDTINKASTVPLTGKIMMDRDELLDYIQEIRLVYPEQLKEAKWVKTERQRILEEAEERADSIKKSAEEMQEKLVDEHEITRQATANANDIISKAQKDGREIKLAAIKFADELLERVEADVKSVGDKLRQGRENLRQ